MMSSKNYYQLLRISPSASAGEIKKAYRRMAFLYHPDRNPRQPGARDSFAQVQEAYEVLSNPVKKRRYDYETFLYRSYGKESFHANSIAELGEHFNQLHTRLRHADPFRIDRDALYFELEALLSDHHLLLLRQESNPVTTISVIRTALDCAQPLSYHAAKSVAALLATVDPANDAIQNLVTGFKREQRLYHYWNRYKILFAFIAALLLCGYIYYLAK